MSSRDIQLALRKQRLQFKCATLRRELALDFEAVIPVFQAGDRVRSGFAWLRAHPEVIAGLAVALFVARPRTVFRWGRRGFFAWQAWRRLSTTEKH